MAIILGLAGFVGGLVLFIYSAQKYESINKGFISDTRNTLSTNLVPFNSRYQNQILFTVNHRGNMFKDKGEADSTIHVNIEIELFVETVQYVPNQRMCHLPYY